MSDPAYDSHVWHDPDEPFPYRSLRPALLDGPPIELPPAIAELVAESEDAIRAWDAAGRAPVATESFARRILHGRDVPPPDSEQAQRNARLDVAADNAVARGVELSGSPVEFADVLGLHAGLGIDASTAARTTYAWLGPDQRTPRDAWYVAPVPELLPGLLDDLVAYLGRCDEPALVQAATAYAQFVTIHPFEDGNGRTARLLAHLVLARRGVATHLPVPFSAGFAVDGSTHSSAIRGLFTLGRRAEWAAVFAVTARRSVETELTLRRRRRVDPPSWTQRFRVVS